MIVNDSVVCPECDREFVPSCKEAMDYDVEGECIVIEYSTECPCCNTSLCIAQLFRYKDTVVEVE